MKSYSHIIYKNSSPHVCIKSCFKTYFFLLTNLHNFWRELHDGRGSSLCHYFLGSNMESLEDCFEYTIIYNYCSNLHSFQVYNPVFIYALLLIANFIIYRYQLRRLNITVTCWLLICNLGFPLFSLWQVHGLFQTSCNPY